MVELGASIGRNTVLELIDIYNADRWPHDPTTIASFIQGLQQNKSISSLKIGNCRTRERCCELLQAFNDGCLRDITILRCILGGEMDHDLATTLSSNTNMETFTIHLTELNTELREYVSAMGRHERLHTLNFSNNFIGRAGCDALSNLLKNPNSNLLTLKLYDNRLDDMCVATIADALIINRKLQRLDLDRNAQITSDGLEVFKQVLCDTSSINATFLSNHSLNEIECDSKVPEDLWDILQLNCGVEDEVLVAKCKVLCCHQHLDMKPFFEWDLGVLPRVVSWFNFIYIRLDNYGMDDEASAKLSSLYQFVRAMPLACIPSPRRQSVGQGIKRKLDEVVNSCGE